MKRLLAAVLTALMVLSMFALVACQNDKTEAPKNTTGTPAKTTGEATEPTKKTEDAQDDDDGSTSDDVFSLLKLTASTADTQAEHQYS